MSWQLRVLGEAVLEGPGIRFVPERKTAALLAFLALEGSANRSRLAGFLWPESGEERARANLRQLLRRLRNATDDDLLESSDLIRLSSQVEVDVLELQAAAIIDGALQGGAFSGELLAGHDYDDCPEFLEWLVAQRDRLVALRRELLEEEVAKRENERDYSGALRLAERLLEFDPLSEQSYRKAMRLHYLAGDRAAALRVFRRCRETLAQELGVEPLPETAALAQEIERQARSLPDRVQYPDLFLALERPPFLVGREGEWSTLEASWRRRKTAIVRGEPGMGKTRLMLDFVAQQGEFLRLASRPGDRRIPYALFSRGWRELLTGSSRLVLPEWARLELGRLVPELEGGPAPAGGLGTDKTRLLQAMALVVKSAADAGYLAIVVDDLHYADDASLEALAYLLPDGSPRDDGPRWLLGYRTGELEPQQENWIEEMVSGDSTVVVDLRPLDVPAIERLVGELSVPTADLAGGLARYTGGNPLFVVETLKNLAETGSLDLPFPRRLPPSLQLGAIIARRLDRLTPGALRLARAIAVLEDAFELGAAAKILDSDPLELAEPLHELESAQLINAEGFSHDLIHQAVLDGIPLAARRLLHRRAAGYLEGIPVPPGLIARHYLEADDELNAAPFLKEAGDSAAAAYRLEEAATLYLQAADLLERNRETAAAFDILSETAELFLKREYGPDHDELERALFRLARTPSQLAVAWQTRAIFLQLVSRAKESEAAAREGHRHAVAAGDAGLQVDLLNNIVGALWLQDRIEETVRILDEAIALGEKCDEPVRLSEALANMGVILDHLDRHREAIEYHERAAALRARHGGRLGQVQVMGNLAVSQAELGLASDSLVTAERMLLLLQEVQGADDLRVHALASAGSALRDLGDLQKSLDFLRRAVHLAQELNTWIEIPVRRQLALTLLALGRLDEAEAELAGADGREEIAGQFRSAVLQVRAQLELSRGGDPAPLLAEAEELLKTSDRPLKKGLLLLARSQVVPAAEAIELAREALALGCERELGGLRIAADTRCAQALLGLGLTGEARTHVEAAYSLLDEYDATDFYLPEVHFTRYRVLAAAGDDAALEALKESLAWIEAATAGLTSEADRGVFRSMNPVNREVLRTVESLGLGTVASG